MADTILSASSVDAYRRCPYRWYLSYVERWQGEGSVRQVLGQAVHKGIETFFQRKLEHDGHGYEDWQILGAYESYDEVVLWGLLDLADPDEDVRKAAARGKRALRVYLEDVAPAITPVGVERSFLITVNGIPYSGYLDVDDTKRVIHDTKVKSGKLALNKTDDYAFAMTGYSLGYRAETGTIESDVVLDIIVALKRDRPYHQLIENGGPSDDHDIRYFATILDRVANDIARNRFPPIGIENGACSWCPVRSVCEPYQEVMARAPQG